MTLTLWQSRQSRMVSWFLWGPICTGNLRPPQLEYFTTTFVSAIIVVYYGTITLWNRSLTLLGSYSPRLILGLKIRTTCQVVQWYWKKPSSQLCVPVICRNLSTLKPGLSLPADDPWKHLTKRRGGRPTRPKRGRNIFKLNLPRDLQNMIWNSSRSGNDGSLQTPYP